MDYDEVASFGAVAVSFAFALVGGPLAPVIGGGLATVVAATGLIPWKRFTRRGRFARRAAKDLDAGCEVDLQGLDPVVRKEVVELCKISLKAMDSTEPERTELLKAALRGPDEFRAALVGGFREVERLEGPSREYLYLLVERIRKLVKNTVDEAPQLGFSVEALKRLEEVQATLDRVATNTDKILDGQAAAATQVGALPDKIVEVLGDKGSAPKRIIAGSRPARAQGFVTRDEMIPLETALAEGGTATVCAQGARGVGKTQLASAFAGQCDSAGWPVVIWINAVSRADTVSELAGIARERHICPEGVLNDEAARRMVDWLQGAEGDRLIVFDNVNDADDIKDLVPCGTGMRVILTTTHQDIAIGTPVQVGVYTEDQAIDYLNDSLHRTDVPGALKVAEALGNLPVALTQAAATMRGYDDLSYDGYLKLLAKVPLVEAMKHEPGSPYTDDAGRALQVAYTSTLKRLAKTTPEVADSARLMLFAMTLLAESGVPREWLYCLADAELTGRAAVKALVDASLLTGLGDGSAVALHRLQAQVIREDWTDDDARLAQHAATTVLAFVKPDSDHMRERANVQQLSSQLAALLEQPQSKALSMDPEVMAVVAATCYRADDIDAPSSGIRLSDYLPICEAALGADAEVTLRLKHNLASAYQSAGDLARAIHLFEATLADLEKLLGPDHPNTLTSRNNLANAYRSAGDLARAIPFYEATLADHERVLGTDHPNTLTSRNNLAAAYESAGDLARAIPLLVATLADRERIIGPEHPGTLRSRNNLAHAYESAGDLARAIPLYEATLADRERVLGSEHPGTLTSRNNLAGAYESAGDLARAIPLYEATLADRERVLGYDHPDTLISRNNLAGAYRSAGDLARAVPLYEATVADQERILGPDHPDTLISRNNLAYAYQSAGDLGRAIQLFEVTLADSERVLGPDHPSTLSSRNNLAGAYESAGDLTRAIPLYEATLADAERILGPDHPDTQLYRRNLAAALEEASHEPPRPQPP